MEEKVKPDKIKEKFVNILDSLSKEPGGKGPASSSLFGSLASDRSAKSPAQDASAKKPRPESPSSEMEEKLKRMEDALREEREKALRLEIVMKEKENVRLEMENMFKGLKDQFRNEKVEKEMDRERENARMRVEMLEKRLEEMNQMLLDALRDQKQAGGTLDEERRSVVQQLESELLEAKKRIGELLPYEGGVAQLKKENQELLEGSKERETGLRAEIENVWKIVQSKDQNAIELTARADDLEVKMRHAVSEMQGQMEKSRKREEELLAEMGKLQQTIRSKEQSVVDLRARTDELDVKMRHTVSESEGQKEKFRKREEELLAAIEGLQQAVRSKDQVMADLQSRANELEVKIRHNEELRQAVGSKDQAMVELQAKSAGLEVRLGRLMAEYQQEAGRFKKLESELSSEVSRLKQVIQSKDQQAAELKGRADGLDARLKQYESELKEQAKKAKEQDGTISDLRMKNAELMSYEEAFVRLKKEKDMLLEEIAKVKQDSMADAQAVCDLQFKVSESEAGIKVLEAEKALLEATIENLRNEMEKVLTELLQSQSRIAELMRYKEFCEHNHSGE